MELSTLDITEAEATAKLAEYEASLRTDRNAEDAAIAAGYRAARRGLPIIRLSKTIQAGGYFPSSLPKLAIARADAVECYVRWSGHELVFADGAAYSNRGALVGRHSVRVPVGDELPGDYQKRWTSGMTLAPLIPPDVRPNPRRLPKLHLLWEVDEWKRTPPRDPALLRHVRGDLWSVLAVWDLTELERYVLSQR